jgi:hypothetical protein
MQRLMVTAAVSFGVGLVASFVILRRARRKLRRQRPAATWSWEEWRDADRVGGAWSPAMGVGTFVVIIVGLVGFGVPGWVRASLLGFVAGVCLPAFTVGVYLKAKGSVQAQPD